MFQGCLGLTTVPKLPAMRVLEGSYKNMFYGCTSLTAVPTDMLPSTALTTECYYCMFFGCVSLTNMPELPATTLAKGCYCGMFTSCTDLTDITSVLPATSLTESCYDYMFGLCGSITRAPELPAPTLVKNCYNTMFNGCTNLSYIRCLATDITAEGCTEDWVSNVAHEGTFVKADEMTVDDGTGWTTNNVSGIPNGWTIMNKSEDLPYVKFTALEDNCSIGLQYISTNQYLEYSTNNEEWEELTDYELVSLNQGEQVYVRGILSGNNDDIDFTNFIVNGRTTVSGNINSLWNYEDLNAPLKEYCGFNLFNSCTGLVDASNLILPSATLADDCYESLFGLCTSLTGIPELPATTLASGCYAGMFVSCTSLTTAPELPATILAEYCYTYMFSGCRNLTSVPTDLLPATEMVPHCYYGMFQSCTNLTSVPELPATILAEYCYSNMFEGCTSLTIAPELPASTLQETSYRYMFKDCTNLRYIKCLATDISAADCTYFWTSGVAPSGTFIKDDNMTGWLPSSVNGIPVGWTAYNKSDEANSHITFTASQGGTTLGLANKNSTHTLEYSEDGVLWEPLTTGTYISLDNGDSVYVRGKLTGTANASNFTQFRTNGAVSVSGNINSLWNYEDLNTPLKNFCGYKLFMACNGLTDASGLIFPTDTLAAYCYGSMFANCANLEYAPELPATTLATNCYSNMFNGCTSLTAAPALPATDLTDCDSCYQQMFYSCYSLNTTPFLPAKKLSKACYSGMFSQCTGLTSTVAILPALTLKKQCYYQMFNGCTSLTKAPELPATALIDNCYRSMFEGCTSINYIKCLATSRLNLNYATSNWVYNVASGGTFVKTTGVEDWLIDSVDGIPSGWTVQEYSELENNVIFTALSTNTQLGLLRKSTHQTLQYSINNAYEWEDWETGYTIEGLTNGDKVYVRGKLTSDNSSGNYTNFSTPLGLLSVKGNINALWDYENVNAPLKEFCGSSLFSGCDKLTDVSELSLPSSALSLNCYYNMFGTCARITTPPELPATILARNCYYNMFYNCLSITSVPELPATALTMSCYSHMFGMCTSLTKGPELPATELDEDCYDSMFSGCSSLTEAPELPATALTSYCYYCMFINCGHLNYIKCLAVDDIGQNNSTTSWVSGVAPSGTFIKGPSVSDWTTGNNGIPNGWTEKDDMTNVPYVMFSAVSPSAVSVTKSSKQALEYSYDGSSWNSGFPTIQLSAFGIRQVYVRGVLSGDNSTTDYTQFSITGNVTVSGNINALWNYQQLNNAPIYKYCGYQLFCDCLGLGYAGDLLIATNQIVGSSCYNSMFKGCSNLQNAPEMNIKNLGTASICFGQMFYGCSNLRNAPRLPATALATNCYTFMFGNCTSLTTAPALPATALTDNCYASMFNGCSHLTIAPDLPAETLVNYCYSNMFYDCTSLNYVKCLAKYNLSSGGLSEWLYNVASGGTFVKDPSISDQTWFDNGVPNDWTITT